MKTYRIRPCAGCGQPLSGRTAALCVFGCGAYYCRRHRDACSREHTKTCPALQQIRDSDSTNGDQS